MTVAHITGPSSAGPGERAEMLERARSFLRDAGVPSEEVVRVDVPGRGAGEDGSGSLRSELEPVVPMIQSGSLFGGVPGLLIVDAHNLQTGEAEVVAGLLSDVVPGSAVVAIVSEGSVPAPLAKFLKTGATTFTVRKIWENSAARWLHDEIHRRGMALDEGASHALIQRFGTDTASLGLALDQLAETPGRITADAVLERFRNRPNEPVFHYTDAVAKGDVGEALRRLGDLMVHQHPLVILATLETELRRRSLALAAPDVDSFREAAGARAGDRWVERVWRQRTRLKDSALRRGLDALVRADRVLKSSPEDLHQVTMERLTVAMCRWLSGR